MYKLSHYDAYWRKAGLAATKVPCRLASCGVVLGKRATDMPGCDPVVSCHWRD